jgi:MarR family transcriptional regulator, organic hydroperoxide resistance regulator
MAPSLALSHDLANSIPYLIARAGVRTGQAFSVELKQFDLSLIEWRVCAALRQQPYQRLSELAVNTSSDASTLSRTVDGMLQKGLLVRERSAEDARAVALALTPAGEALTDSVIPLARLYERVALSGINPQDIDHLRTMLRRIYDNMESLVKSE